MDRFISKAGYTMVLLGAGGGDSDIMAIPGALLLIGLFMILKAKK